MGWRGEIRERIAELEQQRLRLEEQRRQKAGRSGGRAPGGGAQGQSAGDQPPHRRPVGFPGVVQQEERAVQGRMGRTAALRKGSQDELPRSLNLWTFVFLGFCEVRTQQPVRACHDFL
jgi:hypothetical protein